MTTDYMTIIDNTLEQPYSELYRAVHIGDDADILAAFRAMTVACPEVEDWLAKAVGVKVSEVRRALACMGDAVPLDSAGYDDGPRDHEMREMEDVLDSAAMFGTVDEVLDELCETDPKAAHVLHVHYGLGDAEPQLMKDIAADMDRSREMVRRYADRGRKKIMQRLQARGQTT